MRAHRRLARALQNFPGNGAVRLQCAHVRRRSARCLIRPVLRFIAQSPGRACVYLLLATVIVGGALFSLVEPDADWIDGMWWAIVTLTTVGYGDYSPETLAGRWVAVFVMAGGIGAVAILTGMLADEIREARIHDRDETPELDDDIEHVMADHGSRDGQAAREGLAPRGRRRAAQGPHTNSPKEEAL